MEVIISNKGNDYCLEVLGRLDTTKASEFEEKIKFLLVLEEIALTLDIAGLTYISSSGLRCFITLLKTIKAKKGSMKIINMQPEIKEVFDMTGFSNIFEIK